MPLEYSKTVAEILRLFATQGHSQYGLEAVSQLEHALQAAFFAEGAGASTALITAALLHDVGHLLHDLPDDAPERGVDDRHEELAATWLEKHFAAEVFEPARMHVDAKRYLCSAEPEYLKLLSPPSILSLKLQGGAMPDEEMKSFRARPHFDAAIALRRWDDAAKIPRLETPSLAHFVKYVDQVCVTGKDR